MSEAVTVTGTPTYMIDVGGESRSASYVAGSGSGASTSLVFSYTVQAGDNDDAGGITAGTTALVAGSNDAIKDAAGNNADLTTPEIAAATNNVAVDTQAPTVSTVVISGGEPDGSANANILVAGDTILVTVTMSEAVTVTGTPTYMIDVGGESRSASYVAGSGSGASTSLVFSYTVQAGDNDDAGGITAGTTALVAGSNDAIKDAAGNNADLTTPEIAAATNNVAVDTQAPTVSTVVISGGEPDGSANANILVAGDTILVTVTMSEAVTVTGTPTYMIDVGGESRSASYVAGSGSGASTSLVFSYTVQAGDNDDAGGITAGTTALVAGSNDAIKDAAGNNADLTTPEIAATNNVAVDTQAPTVSTVVISGGEPDGSANANILVAGDTILVTVTMSEAVTVTGTPTYMIDVGGESRSASYVAGSGSGASTSLVFSYTVQAGDNDDAGGITAGTTALVAGSNDAIKDAAGNNADLTTPEIAAATNNVAVDTQAPTVSTVVISGGEPDGSANANILVAGDTILVTVTMSEAVTVTGTPTYMIDVGGESRSASYVAGSGSGASTSLVFSYTVQAGDNDDAGGITAGTTALVAGSNDAIKDAAGNNADLTTPEIAAATNNVAVDAQAPTVSTVVISGGEPDGSANANILVAGDTILVTVTMSEAVTVTGTPTYMIDVGGESRSASYVAGSGSGASTSLVFSYTVQAGDNDDAGGITAGTTALVAGSNDAIKDAAGNNADLTTPEIAAATNNVAVDAQAPTVSTVVISGGEPDGSANANILVAGDTILVTVTMSEAVTVTGTPTYMIDVGGESRSASYVAGSGSGASTSLVFSYTVQAGDNDDAGGITAGTTALVAGSNDAIKDAAGNNADLTTPEIAAATNNVAVDTQAPTVSTVVISGGEPDGSANANILVAGDTILVTVTMSEAVTVTGTPTYMIDVGGESRSASYVAGSGSGASTSLVFSYTVQAGDNDDAGGITAGTTALVAGSNDAIKDAAGNNADLTTPEIAAATNNVAVDTQAPTVSTVVISGGEPDGSANANILVAGDTILVTVTMSEAVTVTGTPTYMIDVGGESRSASYVAGSGSGASTSLVFSYTVQAGDNDDAGGITAGTTALVAGSNDAIKDAAGNNADLTTPEIAAATNNVAVDTQAPTVSTVVISGGEPDGSANANILVAGDTILVTVTMSEAVTVTGTPTYMIDVGGESRSASYVAGSGSGASTSLVFSYTVQAGDNDDAGGITAGTTALVAGSNDAIKDAAGNNADLTTPEIAAATNNVAVDTQAPTVSTVVISGGEPDGSANANILVAGDTILVTVTMSEAVTVTGTPTYMIDVGGESRSASYVAGSGSGASTSLVFSYTVQAGDNDDAGGITAGTTALVAGSNDAIKDAAGNNADLTTPEIAATNNVAVDTQAPTVSTVVISGGEPDGSANANILVAGDTILVTVTMSEAVTVTGTPTYMIDVGGESRSASYVAGSGSGASTSLVFSYTVQAGDNDDAGGITAGTTALVAGSNDAIKDAAGNNAVLITPEVAVNANSIEVDTTPPDPFAVKLIMDTGIDDEDMITNIGSLDLYEVDGNGDVIAYMIESERYS